jgi:N utilization substance protein B
VVGLVLGIDGTQADVDGLIERFARGWTIDRMPVVDRAILRIAIYELASTPDTPTGVVISEAVELAKRYSTEDSGRFVNGVLASVAAELRPPA